MQKKTSWKSCNILKLHLEKSPVWQAYLIIIEILTRLGPTVLMIALNIAIIRGFYESIQRKKILRAKRFLQRSESQLVNNKSSKFLRSSKGKKVTPKYGCKKT